MTTAPDLASLIESLRAQQATSSVQRPAYTVRKTRKKRPETTRGWSLTGYDGTVWIKDAT